MMDLEPHTCDTDLLSHCLVEPKPTPLVPPLFAFLWLLRQFDRPVEGVLRGGPPVLPGPGVALRTLETD